jgi:8-oxo-dGTP pyrophosphatase MutT (NUDIX family)
MAETRTACGFVMLRTADAGYEYLLLNNRKRGEPGLPKGHAEEGEGHLAAALRETEEETGLAPPQFTPNTRFQRELHYPAQRAGHAYDKTVVYFLATWHAGEIVLSKEHDRYDWAPLERALYALPYPNLRGVVRDAALYVKDPALFELEVWTEADADGHLAEQPEVTPHLQAHLRGGARLARMFAKGLTKAGVSVHEEAAAAGTLLHDIGRARGNHADHPRAGLQYLRKTRFAPYSFACMSHFTKGATPEALVEAGVDADMLAEVEGLIDLRTLTWEERCAALADACMQGDSVVLPTARFADLRERYGNVPVIDLQEAHTKIIREAFDAALGQDPLKLVGLV